MKTARLREFSGDEDGIHFPGTESNADPVRMRSQRTPVPAEVEPAPAEASDEALVRRVAQGDSAALEALYDRYASRVLGMALRVNGDRAASEDILQETFWRVWRYAGTYQPETGAFAAWLFRITRNLVVDAYRRQSARPQPLSDMVQAQYGPDGANPYEQADPEADVAEQGLALMQHKQVRSALGALPEEQRRVIELAYFHGLTRHEIAEATGEALGTIHTRARLALQKLRKELEKQHFER
jgi:RNA polymerase sigma-70 factor (ECF subfamily)